MNKEEILSLAPAAGSGIGKQIADMLIARPGFIERMADALDNALTAQRRTWDSGSKQWIEEPDTRSQLQAFFGCLAHMEGEPIKRILHQHVGTGDLGKPHEVLSDSPALLEAVQREVAKAQFKTRNRKPTVPGALLDVD